MGVHHLSFKDVQTPVHQCNRHISVPKYVFWYLSRYHEQSAHDTKMKTLTYDTDMENVWRKGESSLTNGSPIAFSNRYERDVISPERPFITAVITNTLDVVAEYVPDSHPDVILYESLKLHVFSRIVARPRGNVDSPHQMYVCGREGGSFAPGPRAPRITRRRAGWCVTTGSLRSARRMYMRTFLHQHTHEAPVQHDTRFKSYLAPLIPPVAPQTCMTRF